MGTALRVRTPGFGIPAHLWAWDDWSLAVGWFVGVEFACEVWGGDYVGFGWVLGFFDFDAEDVAGGEHDAGEEDELLVGGEANVGLFAIVVVGHVDQALGLENAGLPEGGLVER